MGERTREGNDLYREMIESGVIKLGEKQVYSHEITVLVLLWFCFVLFGLFNVLVICVYVSIFIYIYIIIIIIIILDYIPLYFRVKASVHLCTVK